MRRIEFSKHAEKKLKERGILTRLVEETLSSPEKTYKSHNKLISYKKFANRYLMVVYGADEKVIKVKTLFWRDEPNF
jgi:hypothetical protein